MPDNKLILLKDKLRKTFKENFHFFAFLLKKIVNRGIFLCLSFAKRFIRNFLKAILSLLYRLGLTFIADRLLNLYRMFRQRNTIKYNLENKIFNHHRITRLDYHFKHSKNSQEIFNDLKSVIEHTQGNIL